jgi:hypothetical protein
VTFSERPPPICDREICFGKQGMEIRLGLSTQFSSPSKQYRRLTDLRGRMSAYRRIPDLAQRGREGRHMTHGRHSADTTMSPTSRSFPLA